MRHYWQRQPDSSSRITNRPFLWQHRQQQQLGSSRFTVHVGFRTAPSHRATLATLSGRRWTGFEFLHTADRTRTIRCLRRRRFTDTPAPPVRPGRIRSTPRTNSGALPGCASCSTTLRNSTTRTTSTSRPSTVAETICGRPSLVRRGTTKLLQHLYLNDNFFLM